jgi:hypothetical protein
MSMDWIERIFGVSPDGGSGALELLFFALPVIGLYLLHRFRGGRRKRAS